MPLTPEDVANKQFTSTRLKPGYDETEVDEFLDEVEAELTRLYRDNDELRAKLVAGGGGGGGAAPVAAAPDPAVARENEELRAKLAVAQRQLTEASQRASTSQQVAPPAPTPTPAPAAASAPSRAAEGATGILALAQRTADEHIAEARTQAERIVGEARTRAEQLKREADEQHRESIGSLQAEKVTLERKVEELRSFEREYRTRLKSYLEGQLRELEGKGTEAPAGTRGGAQPPQGGGQGGGGQSGGGDQGQGGGGQPQGQPSRGPFSPGAPVGGGGESGAPSGPPQQPSSGYQVDEGSDEK